MSPVLLSGGAVWPRIVKLSAGRNRRMAAIAYLEDDAPTLLGSWHDGDVVICDASDNALRAGSTQPSALSAMTERDVRVVSVERLHAKVIVAGRTAAVGSMNSSQSSALSVRGGLTEAAIETSDRAVVANARLFIRDLISQGTNVDDAFVAHARLLYRPHRQSLQGQGRAKGHLRSFRLHIWDYHEGDPPATVQRTVDREQPKHERVLNLRSATTSRFHGHPISGHATKTGSCGSRTQSKGSLPHALCLSVHRPQGRSKQHVFFWREDVKLQPRPVSEAETFVLASSGRRLPHDGSTRDPATIEAVFRCWGEPPP